MSRFLQIFGQPGAHSLYTIFAGQVIAVKNIVKKKNVHILYVQVFFSVYPNPPRKNS